MTHWLTPENRSKMHKHKKANKMTKKEERAFFGHGFPNPIKWNIGTTDESYSLAQRENNYNQTKSKIDTTDYSINIDDWFK